MRTAEDDTKHLLALCGQNVEFLNVELGGIEDRQCTHNLILRRVNAKTVAMAEQ